MALRYHVNPASGKPGACKATVGSCPFGGQDAHGDTPEAAVASFEQAQDAAFKQELGTVQAQVAAVSELSEGLAHIARREKAYDLTAQERRDLRREKYELLDKWEPLALELERAGMGHAIPDAGPTLRVETLAQKILLKEELLGQISDGMWENTHNSGWETWTSARIVVDPLHTGRNFTVAKDNFQLNSKELLDIVGDRMLLEVRDEPGYKDLYNAKTMHEDLTNLRKVFKTHRGAHGGSSAPAVPVQLDALREKQKKAQERELRAAMRAARDASRAASASVPAPVKKQAPAPAPSGQSTYAKNLGDHSQKGLVQIAVAGPGASKAPTEYYSMHAGLANPSTGDGDEYGHVAPGGCVILGKSDGSRARVVAGAGEMLADPGAELGREVALIKQNQSSDGVNSGLRVLGYVDTKGNQFGWVPNKKIQYFVFK